MPKRYPPLTPPEVSSILSARGFVSDRSKGSHVQYRGTIRGVTRYVTVDTGKHEYSDFLMQSMIRQSGMTREEFYGATKSTARKIGLRHVVELKD